MHISGYHGTSLEAAQSIVASKEFHPSTGDKQWLGDGVYFYFAVDDALNWSNSEAIVHAIVEVEFDNYLDIDSPRGLAVYRKVKEYLSTKYCQYVNDISPQKNQCLVMNIIWEKCSSIEVIAASFASKPTEFKTLIDDRIKRKEFCVRNNKPIKYIHCIKRERLL